MWGWTVLHFHHYAWTQGLAKFARNHLGVSYLDFYEDLLENCIKKDKFLNMLYTQQENQLKDFFWNTESDVVFDNDNVIVVLNQIEWHKNRTDVLETIQSVNETYQLGVGEESDEESDEDDDASEIKRMLKAKTPTRNADMFESKDPTAGQLFVFVGKSERGKTHFLKWLVKDQMRRSVNPLKFGMVMVRTTYKNSYRFVPQEHIFQGYDEEILQQYVSNLERMYEENGSVPPNFIIMDDLVGILNNQTSWFTNLIGTYRHLNINHL